ncbi:hypothetical protein PVAND_002948 [Polypedilum vanderplanki]|uniref:Secreted protein n=1 Tax=Polypedilum vanderplanki TaxID=319348 RepID=A0A9J6BTP3_POLVA|nr:hypothetical protein PVAND_002948 [Polypedilum vanderplanki]
MLRTNIVICGIFVVAFAVLSIKAQNAQTNNNQQPPPIQATSTAKNLNDLTNELLKVVNSNKGAAATDVMPKLIAQTSAAIQTMRNANYYPSQADINTAVQTLTSQLPKDGPITGDAANRFQNGLTRHLSRSFPPKTSS